ncbi:MAG: response regulator [Proteobacteria bacterium]|nr:response regulator [Pseudomonadota bacterium]MBU1388686.1 response regulator [Pseudomonadota bacterium]MBU1541896.1 response regulator [Pseudomonadota bacterium]
METNPQTNDYTICLGDPQTIHEPFNPDDAKLTPEEMKLILETSPAGIAIIKNRVLGWANTIFYSMLGYKEGSLKGRNTRLLYDDDFEFNRVGKSLYSTADKYGNALIETRLKRKDNSFLDCRIRASRIDKKDPDKGFIIIITDISELKLLQTQLQQAQKMEAIGVLAGGISHDFNNILMGIQGHLSLMQIDMTAVEKVRSHTRHITNLVKTAAELTSRLLGFARGGKYQITTLNTNELVVLALNLFKPTRKDITVHEDFEKDLHLVEADQSQLEQVFLNLLINASQAMPGQGDIYAITKNIIIEKDHDYPFEIKPGPYIRITIKDTGIGMDKETQKKIFDPFFSTKEIGDKKGRGLGLSTVFGVVKNHGGFILVDSKKGFGASFHVCLPASKKTPKDKNIEELPKPFEQIQKGSETVLLVDDEQEVINVGKNFLEKLGYTPMIARNGLEAVEIFKLYHKDISLVVLDLVMPVMDGKQAFSEIKEIKKEAKILISTGYAVDDKIEGFLNKDSHGFIQKPFSLNEFASALRKILDKT